ncbi:hypothetical protein E2C01_102027 [Portunus trituberculatus]|uniref:Uncharacterized protein n=1 Tax=Portunus trituberculatus TaxID=210409 RepID=A0A5B7KLS9_PORTR|nr:hypothetical protein [Portunus trituberculatus]
MHRPRHSKLFCGSHHCLNREEEVPATAYRLHARESVTKPAAACRNDRRQDHTTPAWTPTRGCRTPRHV